jgi:hypothetical protein
MHGRSAKSEDTFVPPCAHPILPGLKSFAMSTWPNQALHAMRAALCGLAIRRSCCAALMRELDRWP